MELTFREEMECLICYAPSPGETELVIPEGVRELAYQAFFKADKLHSIRLPSTLECIEDNAFENCTVLEELTLPDNTAAISSDAFEECSIKRLIIPANFQAMELDYQSIRPEKSPERKKRHLLRHLPSDWDSMINEDDLEDTLEEDYIYANTLYDGDYGWSFTEDDWLEITLGRPPRWNYRRLPLKADPREGMAFICSACQLEEIIVSDENPLYAAFDGALYDKHLESLLAVPAAKPFLTFPASLKSMEIISPHGCSDLMGSLALREIAVAEENPYFTAFDGALYDKALHRLLYMPGQKQTVHFPDTLREIAFGAFEGTAIPDVRLPDGLETIGNHAFSNPAEELRIFVPESVKYIGYFAFHPQSQVTIRCKNRDVTFCVSRERDHWELDANENWLVLLVLRTEDDAECTALFQSMKAYRKELIMDLCKLHPDCVEFRTYLRSIGEEMAEHFLKCDQFDRLSLLLELDGITPESALKLTEKANACQKYEAQMMLMCYACEAGDSSGWFGL